MHFVIMGAKPLKNETILAESLPKLDFETLKRPGL